MRIDPLTLKMADHSRKVRPMCDYQTLIPTTDGSPVQTKYCQRAPKFWVQSLLSTHNMLACPQHLARIVRQIEAEAWKFDIMGGSTSKPDVRFALSGTLGVVKRITREDSNYARVTVKPYTRKAH